MLRPFVVCCMVGGCSSASFPTNSHPIRWTGDTHARIVGTLEGHRIDVDTQGDAPDHIDCALEFDDVTGDHTGRLEVAEVNVWYVDPSGLEQRFELEIDAEELRDLPLDDARRISSTDDNTAPDDAVFLEVEGWWEAPTGAFVEFERSDATGLLTLTELRGVDNPFATPKTLDARTIGGTFELSWPSGDQLIGSVRTPCTEVDW